MKAATHSRIPCAVRALISIHAAREGGDRLWNRRAILHLRFQSTPPVKAATVSAYGGSQYITVFQSTPPVKAATSDAQRDTFERLIFQSTPPVKAATIESALNALILAISIHAAREGGDVSEQTAPSGWRISIHAAREGGDSLQLCPCNGSRHFNPRRP